MSIEVIDTEKQIIKRLANLSSIGDIIEHKGGWDSRVYGFDNDRYFFKFPRTDKIKESYANEIAALKLANSLGTKIKIPTIIWEHPNNAYFGYEGQRGVPLNTIFDELGVEAKQSIGTALGEFLKNFHNCELKGALMVNAAEEVAQLQRWYGDVLLAVKQLFTENEQLCLEGLVFKQIPEKIKEQGSSMRLGHGDLASWNIIYGEAGQVGIIDFGKVCYSDPTRDLIYVGDKVITEYSMRAYGDNAQLREKTEARVLYPEINSLLYYSGKGNNVGVAKTAAKIRKLIHETV